VPSTGDLVRVASFHFQEERHGHSRYDFYFHKISLSFQDGLRRWKTKFLPDIVRLPTAVVGKSRAPPLQKIFFGQSCLEHPDYVKLYYVPQDANFVARVVPVSR
jgi:hypothetical protein